MTAHYVHTLPFEVFAIVVGQDVEFLLAFHNGNLKHQTSTSIDSSHSGTTSYKIEVALVTQTGRSCAVMRPTGEKRIWCPRISTFTTVETAVIATSNSSMLDLS